MTLTAQEYLAKARRNIEAAEGLAQMGYFEISISRAYYVMFYVPSALLLHEGLTFSKHSAVDLSLQPLFRQDGANGC